MRAAAQEREQASLGHAELGGVTRHPKSQDWSWTLEGEFPEGSRSELPEKLNMRPHKTPQTRGKRGQKRRRNNGETRTKPGRRGAPEITAEKAAKRTHAHGVCFLGRWTADKSTVFGNKTIFKEAVSAKWGVRGVAAARQRWIREAWSRGRQQVQSTCQGNVTVREKRKRS